MKMFDYVGNFSCRGAKVIENVQLDINIALVNELATIACSYVDVEDVLSACNISGIFIDTMGVGAINYSSRPILHDSKSR